jgi:cytoskeletal protein RodZ
MDSNGNIYTPAQIRAMREALGIDAATQLERAAKMVEVPGKDVPKLMAMNRKQRRAWHAERRRAEKRERGKRR